MPAELVLWFECGEMSSACQELTWRLVTSLVFAAVSLYMVYLTMTKKMFMATKLTPEPAEIHGGNVPLKEIKNLQ